VRTTYSPPHLAVYELQPGEALICWRIVRSDNPGDPVFLNSLRSHHELSQEPRHVERSSRLIHLGISAYVERRVATDTAIRFPKIGAWVAQLRLGHGYGFNYAQTGHRHHLTIWGDPIKLADSLVDIKPSGL
jgi:hypothetical protein